MSEARTNLGPHFDTLGPSPAPQQHVDALLSVFNSTELAELLVISPTSVRRYARGSRHPAAPVMDRLQYLALVSWHLAGTYNHFGIRRWFDRPRLPLNGDSPKQALLTHAAWSPESKGARNVLHLAKALAAQPIT